MTRYTHTLRSDDLRANEIKIQHCSHVFTLVIVTPPTVGFSPATLELLIPALSFSRVRSRQIAHKKCRYTSLHLEFQHLHRVFTAGIDVFT